ncbi:putative cell wall protein [Macadamia integrifolia]|uniref:putative cell wall protein n=1 Tax=Macadamia integrifolia TaxID=60698 RepID=UPI001C53219E|nr:putative cell wall protein [Macadamia integrifolia]
MATHSPSSLLPMFLIFTILLATLIQVAVAGREIPTKANVADKKQPEWFIDSDGNVFIPGIGRVQVPALAGFHSFPPYSGGGTGDIGGGGNSGTGGGNSGTGSTEGGSPSTPGYVPGGDDTFVPNPGVEVPTGGGGVPTPQVPIGGGGVPTPQVPIGGGGVPTPQTARP